jgi:hypothetical protein
MKYAEIQRKEDDDAENEGNPVPGGDLNQRKHFTATCASLAENAKNASPAQ